MKTVLRKATALLSAFCLLLSLCGAPASEMPNEDPAPAQPTVLDRLRSFFSLLLSFLTGRQA